VFGLRKSHVEKIIAPAGLSCYIALVTDDSISINIYSCEGRFMANKKIEDIEGIGPVLGEKLRAAGVKDTDSLLKQSMTRAQRKALAEKSGLTVKQVLKFANMADLYRVKGIGSEYSELLEAAGVDTVPELARRNAANLAASMVQTNEVRKLVRRTPTVAEVQGWIDQAKTLGRVLSY
jgi:predicted flap endonuclease-1-like 5' DNA nuclease